MKPCLYLLGFVVAALFVPAIWVAAFVVCFVVAWAAMAIGTGGRR